MPKLYVIIDTKGSGRLLAVFDDIAKATKIVDKYPAYYKMVEAQLNEINPETLKWVCDDKQKTFLKEFK
ncbi:hypothetical protein [Rubellicoccus peritrichatus]|uniref:Uncharacterized protein n=1 Tax=Rubellicoccus peritrichatus TaxID=3080537 RepID=A0AAQ3LGI6_9BACT|nr:hypothetical protein [Puniceicoccus sp. CR14]WOO41704.1 hypothetical protein RZN69_01290 [Puniceicoccus sp. CR14]